MKLSETANEVIALASAIHDYWETELPKRHRQYPLVSPGEDSGPPPPEEEKLKSLLESLPEEAIYQLGLLAYVGRGSFGTDDLAGHYETVKERFGKGDWAISHLLGMVPLGEHLADGMAELKKSGIDLDHLTFASVNAGS